MDHIKCPVCGYWTSTRLKNVATTMCILCKIEFGVVVITKQEAKNAIEHLIDQERAEWALGGDEDEYGTLLPGCPDFDRLQGSLHNVIDLMR